MVAKKQLGFTIIELMIAMIVFSTMMVIASTVIIGVSKQYQKSTKYSELNDASRNLHESLAQSIGYSSDGPYEVITTSGYKHICIGQDLYYWKISSGANIYPGLFKYTFPYVGAACGFDPANLPNSVNLLPKDGFVTTFSISKIENTNSYDITTAFKIGTVDMYKDGSVNNNCLPTQKGGEFCSEIIYNSTVSKRL